MHSPKVAQLILDFGSFWAAASFDKCCVLQKRFLWYWLLNGGSAGGGCLLQPAH